MTKRQQGQLLEAEQKLAAAVDAVLLARDRHRAGSPELADALAAYERALLTWLRAGGRPATFS